MQKEQKTSTSLPCLQNIQMEGRLVTGLVVTMRVTITGEELSERSKSAAVPSTKPALIQSSSATVMQTIGSGKTRMHQLPCFFFLIIFVAITKRIYIQIAAFQVLG